MRCPIHPEVWLHEDMMETKGFCPDCDKWYPLRNTTMSGFLDKSVTPDLCRVKTSWILYYLGFHVVEFGTARPIIFEQPSMIKQCYLRYFESMQREYNPFEYDMPFNWVTGWFSNL